MRKKRRPAGGRVYVARTEYYTAVTARSGLIKPNFYRFTGEKWLTVILSNVLSKWFNDVESQRCCSIIFLKGDNVVIYQDPTEQRLGYIY